MRGRAAHRCPRRRCCEPATRWISVSPTRTGTIGENSVPNTATPTDSVTSAAVPNVINRTIRRTSSAPRAGASDASWPPRGAGGRERRPRRERVSHISLVPDGWAARRGRTGAAGLAFRVQVMAARRAPPLPHRATAGCRDDLARVPFGRRRDRRSSRRFRRVRARCWSPTAARSRSARSAPRTSSGISTVAIFPYEDRNSLHRAKADESYQIGEVGHPVRAYLSVDEVIKAAQRAGADAVYPGYGFLSENPDLAEACERGRHHVRRPAARRCCT